MKIIVCLCTVCIMAAAGDFIGLLEDFRQNCALSLGNGIGKSTAQVLEERRGNHLELTKAFQDILTQHGYESQIIQGTIQLSPQQKSAWSHCNWMEWNKLLGCPDGNITANDCQCGISWLKVYLPAIPDMLSRSNSYAPGAYAWINVFPALNGISIPKENILTSCPVDLKNAISQQLQSLTAWNLTNQNTKKLISFPQQEIRQAVTDLLFDFAKSRTDNTAICSHAAGIPGYKNMTALNPSPVTVISSNNLQEDMEAIVSFELSDDTDTLLSFQQRQSDMVGKTISVTWLWSDTFAEPQINDHLFQRFLVPSLFIAGSKVASSDKTLAFGKRLNITIRRFIPATNSFSDKLTGNIISGEEAVLVLSSGYTKIHDSSNKVLEKLCIMARGIHDKVSEAVNIASGTLYSGQLHGSIASHTPVCHKVQGSPFILDGFSTSLASLGDLPNIHETNSFHHNQNTISGLHFLRKAALNAASDLCLQQSGKHPVHSAVASFHNAILSKSDIFSWRGSKDTLPEALKTAFLAYHLENEKTYSITWVSDSTFIHAFISDDIQCQTWTYNGEIQQWFQNQSSSPYITEIHTSINLSPESMLPAYNLAAHIVSNTSIDSCTQNTGAAFILSHAMEKAANEPIIDNFQIARRLCKSDEDAVISFSASNVTHCDITIYDSDHTIIASFTNLEPIQDFRWQFQDREGNKCDDGLFTISLSAWNDIIVTHKQDTVILDTTPPKVTLKATAANGVNGTTAKVDFEVQDQNPTTTSLRVTDEDNRIIFTNETEDTKGELVIPVSMEGLYTAYLCTSDGCNSSETSYQFNVSTVTRNQPKVRIQIDGLDKDRRLVASSFQTTVKAFDFISIHSISLYLDSELLAESFSGSVLNTVCHMSAWQEGPHTLSAIAVDSTGSLYASNEITFYYSTLADDFFAPDIDIVFNSWPPNSGTSADISAYDNVSLANIAVRNGNSILASVTPPVNSKHAVINNAAISSENLAKGITLTATDSNGNITNKIIQFKNTGTQPVPVLDMVSEAFDGKEHDSQVIIYVTCNNTDIACMQLQLNGVMHDSIFFPDGNIATFSISPDILLDGKNTVSTKAWSIFGAESQWIHASIKTPVLRKLKVTPEIVRPWEGTASEISVTAETRQEHEWQVVLSGMNKSLQCSSKGKNINALFKTNDLPDGDYSICISIPELDFQTSIPVTVDAIRGMPVAEITYPCDGDIVTEGILRVLGSAKTTADDTGVSYCLQIFDEKRTPLQLTDESVQDEWRLFPVIKTIKNDEELQTPWRDSAVTNGNLAAIDLSTLPNGRYSISLTTFHTGQYKTANIVFNLNSQMKTNYFTFAEDDFTAFAGNMPVKFARAYSTQNKYDSGFGYGWTHSINTMDPVIDDIRTETTDIGGNSVSLRTGGSRDVTVTLPNGERTTFVFSLEEGGGWSFCYYATWTSKSNPYASLQPTCSNKLMTLSGLEPYWEAAGPSTPWQLFDFPGFILTLADGSSFLLERKFLGSADLLGDGGNGIENGEYAYVDTFGDLAVTKRIASNGHTIEFSEDSVTAFFTNGDSEQILEFIHDPETGRVIKASSFTGLNTQIHFEYDSIGNLVSTKRGTNGIEPSLYRIYEYALPSFPHHITAIRGPEQLLLSVSYDAQGRMTAVQGGDGSLCSSQGNPFSGYEIKKDSLGRETLYMYTQQGLITSQTAPGGATTKYKYDEHGREIQITDPAGKVETKEYDDSGNITAIIDKAGNKTTYSYNTDDKCTMVTDPIGRTSSFEYDSNGNITQIKTFTDIDIYSPCAPNGSPTSLSMDNTTAWMTYNKHGQITSMADDHGIRYDFSYNEQGQNTLTEVTLFHPTTNEEIVHSVICEYDQQGHLIYKEGSNGTWLKNNFNSLGKLGLSLDSEGNSTSYLYDAGHREVQIIYNENTVTRMGYDIAGRIIFQTEPQHFPIIPSDNTLVFNCVKCFSYNEAGQMTTTTTFHDTTIKLINTGNESWEAVISENGTQFSSISNDFDIIGRPVKKTSKEGLVTCLQYDDSGRIASITDASGDKTSWVYGKGGLLEKTISPAGGITSFRYDSYGFTSSITSPNGFVTCMDNDKHGRITAIHSPDKCSTFFERDRDGKLTKVSLPANDDTAPATYSYDYDSVSSLSSITTPNGSTTQFINDEFGRRCHVILPLGQKCHYSYHNSNLYPSIYTDFEGNTARFSYGQGEIVKSISFFTNNSETPLKTYNFTHTPSGLLESVTLEKNNSTLSTFFSYDANHLLSEKRMNDSVIRISHDLDGRIKSLSTDLLNASFAYSHETHSSSISLSPPRVTDSSNNEHFHLVYDSFGKIKENTRHDRRKRSISRNIMGNTSSITEYDKTGSAILQIDYVRDINERIIASTEKWHTPSFKHARSLTREYDKLGRLIYENSDSDYSEETYSLSMEYDINGNRIALYKTDAYGIQESNNFTFDENDRLVSCSRTRNGQTFEEILSWNDNGSLVSIHKEHDTLFTWDAEGLLKTVTGRMADGSEYFVEFLYDTQGLLYKDIVTITSMGATKTFHRFYSYLQLHKNGPQVLLNIRIEDQFGNSIVRQSNIWAEGLAAISTGDSTISCITDASGSLRSVENSYFQSYDPWGNRLLQTDIHQIIGFNGEWHDPVTGLVYLRSRFYLPEYAIFISRDKINEVIEQPLSINKYAYCQNDPVNRTDPNGTFSMMSLLSSTLIHSSPFLTGLIYAEAVFDFITEATMFQNMICFFSNMKKRNNNATVIVHGVGHHDVNSNDDFIKRLKSQAANQDYLSFLWSGFSDSGLIPILPNHLQNNIATLSLMYSLAILYSKAYSKINVVAHSWGTVLSNNVMMSQIIPIGLWATMGSPLCYNPLVLYLSNYRYDHWLNIYTLSDPVVYLRMDAPGLPKAYSFPLFLSSKPTQVNLGYMGLPGLAPHSVYWTDPITIGGITQILEMQ